MKKEDIWKDIPDYEGLYDNNKVYNSLKDACNELVLDKSNLSKVLKGKKKTIKGYSFSYYEG